MTETLNPKISAALELLKLRGDTHLLVVGGNNVSEYCKKLPLALHDQPATPEDKSRRKKAKPFREYNADNLHLLDEWQLKPLDLSDDTTLERASQAIEDGHMFGIAMTAKSRLICLDCDFNSEDALHNARKIAVDKFGPELLFYPSENDPKCKGHAWYEVDQECANWYLDPRYEKLAPKKWYIDGRCCGEIRFVKGQMALHGDEIVRLVECLKHPEPSAPICLTTLSEGPWHRNDDKRKSAERVAFNKDKDTSSNGSSGHRKYSTAKLLEYATDNWNALKRGEYANLYPDPLEEGGKCGARHDAFFSCCIRNYQLLHSICSEENIIKEMCKVMRELKPEEKNPERIARDAIARALQSPDELHYPTDVGKSETSTEAGEDDDNSCDVRGGMIEIENIGPIGSNYHKYVRLCLEEIDLIPKLNLLTSEWSIIDPSKKYLKSGEWMSTSRDALHRVFQETFYIIKKSKDKNTGEWKRYSSGLGLSTKQIMSGIKSFAEDNMFNPLHDYIERIYKEYIGLKDHLGVELQETIAKDFISEIFNVECSGEVHGKINRWAGKAIFRQVLQRELFPGCKINSWVALNGREGCGKSSAVEQHLPTELRESLFSDELDFRQEYEKKVRSIRHILLLEAGESVGFGKADQNTIKQFLSATHDKDRRLHQDEVINRPRSMVFVLTGNHPDYLSAEEQNRRFVTVMIIEQSKIDPAIWFNDLPIEGCNLTNRDLQYCGVVDELIEAGLIKLNDGKLEYDEKCLRYKNIVNDLPRSLWEENMRQARKNTNAPETFKSLIEFACETIIEQDGFKSVLLDKSEVYRPDELITILANAQFMRDCENHGTPDKIPEAKIKIEERFSSARNIREIKKAMRSLGWRPDRARKRDKWSGIQRCLRYEP